MTAPARVLMVAKGLGRGGTERLLASGLALLDPERFLAEVAYVLPGKDALVPEVEATGALVHCVGSAPRGQVAWPARLVRLVRLGRFDIVHTHMPAPAVVARLAVSGRRPALVHTEHNVWPRYRAATRWANALTYHRNAAVLAVSSGVAETIRPPALGRWLQAPAAEVLIHGIDRTVVRRGPAARVAARATLGVDEGALVVGSVGNFTAKKDHRTLLEAFASLAVRHPTLQLVLVGSGPLERDLRAHADALVPGGRVKWTGSRGDVADLLPAFDVFALSSRHEGLSIALIEALAAGLACVATDVGGIPEVVVDGVNGMLVPPGRPAELAAAIELLLLDDQYRLALARRAVARSEHFSLTAAMGRLQDVYQAALAAL